MSDWALVYTGYEPEREGLREALCTLGNGVFATRGAAPDSRADGTHYPGTYLAGGYDRARSEVRGREIENEDLVNFPNWLPLTFRVGDGDWFATDSVELLDYRQELDLGGGLLLRELRFRDAAGRTTRWTERRIVSMARPYLAALCVELAPEDWDGLIQVRSGLDGNVTNTGVPRYRDLEGRHLEVLAARRTGEEGILLHARTLQSRLEVAEVARTRLYQGERGAEAERSTLEETGWIAELIGVEVGRGSPVRIEKVVALRSSRDCAISEAGLDAAERAAQAPGFDALAAEHRRCWLDLWRTFDLELDLTDEREQADTQRKLRLHTFHLLQSASPHTRDLDVGVPARGWHGEAYRGHIFWDELFILPLLSLRMPSLARALLLYRHRRLEAARRAAREAGYGGAMFPWQSGSDGREESQRLHLNPKSGSWNPDPTQRQRHIGAAIAYNVWHYHQVTGDDDFLYFYGAEIMVEVARFWASIAVYAEDSDRYEIRGVMGPDEYHTAYPDADPEREGGLDNNAYTNVMAAWVLEAARDALDLLPEHRRQALKEELGLSPEEIAGWREISLKLRLCFHEGVLSQFEGYERLEELDWKTLRERHGDIQRLDRVLEADGDTPNRYRVSKQADVLMLFYLFSTRELRRLFQHMGYAWDGDVVPRNVQYYLARTSHGSTLSRVVHAWVLARSDRPASWKLFRDALSSDVEDVQGGTTPEGIHLGAMAGTVDLVQRCYTGIESRGQALHFNPCLPRDLKGLRLKLHYRRHLLDVEIRRETLYVSSRPQLAFPITIAYRDHFRRLSPGERCSFELLTPENRKRENTPE